MDGRRLYCMLRWVRIGIQVVLARVSSTRRHGGRGRSCRCNLSQHRFHYMYDFMQILCCRNTTTSSTIRGHDCSCSGSTISARLAACSQLGSLVLATQYNYYYVNMIRTPVCSCQCHVESCVHVVCFRASTRCQSCINYLNMMMVCRVTQ